MLQSELSAEDLGWISASQNAESMLTDEWRKKIAALVAADARRFVLLSLEKSISGMKLADPAKPAS